VGMAEIREAYDVPAKKCMRVTVDGRYGVIVGTTGDQIRVRFADSPASVPCHPRWRVVYHVPFTGDVATDMD
jgi:hypothetical protein